MAAQKGHVLGVDFGTPTAATDQFVDVTAKVRGIHEALVLLGDAPTELALLRKCADTCKIAHLVRAAGTGAGY